MIDIKELTRPYKRIENHIFNIKLKKTKFYRKNYFTYSIFTNPTLSHLLQPQLQQLDNIFLKSNCIQYKYKRHQLYMIKQKVICQLFLIILLKQRLKIIEIPKSIVESQIQSNQRTIKMSKIDLVSINVNLSQSIKPVFLQDSISVPFQRDNQSRAACQICFSHPVVRIATLTNCAHANKFCESCLYNHVVYKISQFQEVTCPQENCGNEIDNQGQLFKGYPNKVQMGYNKIKRFYSTIKDSTIRLCPSPDCEGIIKIEQNQPLKCQRCQNEFCFNCLLKIHQGPCDEYEKNFLIQNLKYRQCSKCRMMIQKYKGCNQMTCLCNYQFCYICQSQWSKSHHGKHDSKGNLIILSCFDICLQLLKIILFFPLWILAFIIIYSPLIVLQIIVVLILSIFRGMVLQPFLMEPVCELNKWIFAIIVVIFYPIFAIIGMMSALGKMCNEESDTIFFLFACDKGKANLINYLCSIFNWIFQKD